MEHFVAHVMHLVGEAVQGAGSHWARLGAVRAGRAVLWLSGGHWTELNTPGGSLLGQSS